MNTHTNNSVHVNDVWSIHGEKKPVYTNFRSDPLAAVMEFIDQNTQKGDPGAHYYALFHKHSQDAGGNLFGSDAPTDKINPACSQMIPNEEYLELSKQIRNHFHTEMSMRKLNDMHYTQWQSDLIVLLHDLEQNRVSNEHTGMLVCLRDLYFHDLEMDQIQKSFQTWQQGTPEDGISVKAPWPIKVKVERWVNKPQKSAKQYAMAICRTEHNEMVQIHVTRPHDQVWRQLLKYETEFTFQGGIIARSNHGFQFMKINNPRIITDE